MHVHSEVKASQDTSEQVVAFGFVFRGLAFEQKVH